MNSAESGHEPAAQADATERVIPIVEEVVRAGKRVVQRKRHIVKTTRIEDQYVEEPIFREDVEITRVPINREIDGPVSIRHEGDTTIIPVVEEVLVIEKRLMLREEIHVARQRTEVREVRHVPLRKTDITIEGPDKGHKSVEVSEK